MMQTTSPPSSLVSATGSTVIDAADPLVSQIDALLPQTQCRQCGYEGCRPYAAALALGKAEINQCPPGGEAGVRALANLLTRPVLPLNSAHGIPKGKWLAVIDENRCIGCTLCIQACPVDAILGASKRMHTVIQQECTGCELCLPPCPVDCIDMIEVADRPQAMNTAESDLARRRHAHKIARQTLEKQPRAQTSHTQTIAATAVTAETTAPSTDALKKAALAAAMARVKAQKTE